MRRLTFRPALTISGRKNKGLRGFAGKPFHPPLTDVPITAYLFAAVFDVLSVALHSSHHEVGRQLYVAGTWTLLGGAAVSLLAALTGWADWHRSSEPGTQARGALNAAYLAGDPSHRGTRSLEALWSGLQRRDVFPVPGAGALRALAGRHDHLIDPAPLRRLVATHLPFTRLEDAPWPVAVVATE